MKKITFFTLVLSLISTTCFAANHSADARGLDEYGNWQPLRLDSSDNLLVVGGAA